MSFITLLIFFEVTPTLYCDFVLHSLKSRMLCLQFCLTYMYLSNCHFFTNKQFPKSNYVISVQRFSCCYDFKHPDWLIKFIKNALEELGLGMNQVCIHIQCKLANMKTNATVISKLISKLIRT